MASKRKIRRTAGFIARFFPNKLFRYADQADGRSRQGRSWKSPIPLFKAALLGIAAGCKGLKEVEELTQQMFAPVRKLVSIPSRIPDTTLRDFLCNVVPEQLCDWLSMVGYDAWRRKAIRLVQGIPFHAMSLDGKYPSVSDTQDYDYLQVHHDTEGNAAYGLLRTVTATLVTAVGRPIMGITPIAGSTNEQGSFKKAFGDLVRVYGRLFVMVMYDAGAASLSNASAVVKAGKHYFFQIADPRWHMVQAVERLFQGKEASFCDEQKVSRYQRIVRELTILSVPEEIQHSLWEHTRTLLKVYSETYKDGRLAGTKTRYFVCSMLFSKLIPEQWLALIILRWGVETSHQILDLGNAFDEDNHPWIHANAQGALVVQILRRIVYTAMTLYRSVTLRSEEGSTAPWRCHMEWIKDTLKWPNPEEMQDLRPRTFAVPPAFV